MKRFVFVVITAAACSKPSEAPPPQPASLVTVTTVTPKLIEASTEYLATLTSRHAVSLYPQVSGYVRAISVKPGMTVKRGMPLIEVDATAEHASMQNLVATRDSLVASAAFARDRQTRSKVLRGDGIVSQQDADQAQAQADQAEATVHATDALIASAKARLSFFTIVAPFEGVVGNVPVKVGDFVTPATMLTSVTQDAGLEAEVLVPVERSTSLGPTSRIRVLTNENEVLGESPVVFISPRVDPATQLLLIKGAFAAMPSLRAEQIVRAQVVWHAAPGLAVPTVSIVRQAGQAFVYVVNKGVARRTPVVLGAIQGNEYVVTTGLSGGEQVVVSGVQQIGDGSSVELQVRK
jgi:RND family efflux transporter MFP subunit